MASPALPIEPLASAAVIARVPYTHPFGWAGMLGFFRQRCIAGIEVVDENSYRRSVTIGGEPAILTVVHDGESGELVASVEAATRAEALVADRIALMFDTAVDLAAVTRHLAADPVLGPMIAARPAIRIPGHWSSFETAIRAILGQQVTLAAARLLASRLVERAGPRLLGPAEGGITHLFPSPEQLLAADLSAMGMPGSRVRTLQAMSAAVLDDPMLLRRGASIEETVDTLSRIKGIGPWSAHYIALRACREPDAFPASDVGLLRGMAESGQRPSPAALLARAEAWRPYRAYAAHHIWASLA